MGIQKVYATEDDVGFDRSPFLTTTEMDILRSAGFTVAIVFGKHKFLQCGT
jgi:hypothetical protein